MADSIADQVRLEIQAQYSFKQWFQRRILETFDREFPHFKEKLRENDLSRAQYEWLKAFMARSSHNGLVGGLQLIRYMPRNSIEAREGLLKVFEAMSEKYLNDPQNADALTDSIVNYLSRRPLIAQRVSKYAHQWEMAQTEAVHVMSEMRKDRGDPPLLLGLNPTRDI